MYCCADKASAWLWKWSEAYHEQLCAAANLKSKDYACEKRWTGRPSTEINQRTTSTIWDYSLGFLLARWQESEYSELVVLKCVLFWWFFLPVFNCPLCCVHGRMSASHLRCLKHLGRYLGGAVVPVFSIVELLFLQSWWNGTLSTTKTRELEYLKICVFLGWRTIVKQYSFGWSWKSTCKSKAFDMFMVWPVQCLIEFCHEITFTKLNNFVIIKKSSCILIRINHRGILIFTAVHLICQKLTT